jgi:hypothetical protein
MPELTLIALAAAATVDPILAQTHGTACCSTTITLLLAIESSQCIVDTCIM